MANSFIVYKDWVESFKDLDIETQDKIIADTVRYGLGQPLQYGEDPLVKSFVKMKSKDIDYGIEKYEMKKSMAKIAGRKKKVDDGIIWEMAGRGMRAQEIADELGISKTSVDHSEGWKQRKNLYLKL